jgi:putative ABC transport system permease protein
MRQVRGLTRLALLMLGAMVAGYLLLFGGAMRDSINTLIRGAFQDVKYNDTYLLASPQTVDPWGGEPLTIVPFTTVDGKLTFQAMGLPPTTTLLTPRDSTGTAIPIDRVIITQALAQKLDLRQGDTWTVRQAATGDELTLSVDAVSEMYASAAVIMPQERLNAIAGLPSGSFNALLSTSTLDIPPQNVLTMMSMAQSKAAFDSALEPMYAGIGVMAVTAVFIALIALSVVTTLAVEEERLSISLLKVLGYRDAELNAMILGSGLAALLTGFVISIPLLLSSVSRLFTTTTADTSFSLPIRLSPLSIAVCLAIMLGTYAASLRAARRKVLAVQMAVSLKAARE